MQDSMLLQGTERQSEFESLSLNLRKAATSTDDIRSLLGLAPVEWKWQDAEEADNSEETDEELLALKQLDVFYKAVDQLKDTQTRFQISDKFVQVLTEQGIVEHCNQRNIQYKQTSANSADFSDSANLFFTVTWSETSGLEIQYPGGDSSEPVTGPEIILALDEQLRIQKANSIRATDFTNKIRTLLNNQEISTLVNEKDLKPRYYQNGNQWELAIRLVDYTEVERISVDPVKGEILFDGKGYTDYENFVNQFIIYLTELDPRTEIQIAQDEAQDLVKRALDSPEFIEYLDQYNYQVSDQYREDPESDYRHWDITENGEKVGSIALLLGTSELYLLDADDIQIRSFRGFTENHIVIGDSTYEYSDDFEVLTDLYNSSSSDTFLLIGTHEKNADTMIIVHSDMTTGISYMISIPRDLWFNNRKINSVYRYYGPEALVKEVSDLTGLQIDDYISVDMYAFIEVVDIMGGVDITLDTPLIDPTYKIKENGQWTTLNYPAGDVHLDGIAALRVARSRHTSNDFKRGSRQQQVIEAMVQKAMGMAKSDLDSLFRFISTALEYTESSMSAAEILRTFLKYKDTDIETGNVISTSNILYASYSNLYQLSDEEQTAAREDEDFNWGAWIVLPKNNDWNLIKWYIREMIES